MNDETFQFTDAKQLRDFLNQFKETDLSTVYLKTRTNEDFVSVDYIENDMGDDSKTIDLRFS